MRRLAAAACSLVMACTSTGGGGAPEPAPGPRPIAYRPDTARYLLVSHRTVETDNQGQTFVQESHSRVWIATALGTAGPDGLPVRITVDSIANTGDAFAAGDIAAMRGASWSGRLLPTGEIADLSGPEGAGVAAQLSAELGSFFPRLPAAGALPGDAWVDTVTSVVNAGGVELTVVTVNRSAAIGPRPWDGREAFLIRVTSDYTVTGEGSQSGQPLALDGTGRRHTDEYIAPDGRYLGNVLADTSSYDIVLTALGMSLPGQQLRHDTLRVR